MALTNGGAMGKKTGTNMSWETWNPRYRKRRDAKRRAEERSWAARSGPVVIIRAASGGRSDLQSEYAVDGAAGDRETRKPAA